MLQLQELTYHIGTRQLINGVTWAIQPGKRAALIGPNGAGKTTLLRLLTNELTPLSGAIVKPKDYRIGYLPQEEIAVGRGHILQMVLEGRQDLLDIERRMADLHTRIDQQPEKAETLVHQLSRLEEQYAHADGYRLESQAKSILVGLGFPTDAFERPLSEFSGGWRMRVYLAKLLIQNPDLLLLDEPTNHLDIPSLEWLEQHLLSFAGSMIIVSHDRFFIDRLAQEIYELDRGKLTHYAGNYHFYETEREKRYELLLKQYEEQKAERERQERFVERFRYKATKAAAVQSRVKMLEKMEVIDIEPRQTRHFAFQLKVNEQSYKDVLTIEKMSFRYDQPWVLQDVNLKIYRGEKVALVGVNGAGKTTITRLIAGELPPTQGSIALGNRTKVGYYAQHQVDALDLKSTVYSEVANSVAINDVPNIRNVLGLFRFRGDDINKRIEVLSGGEKARVSLTKILLSPVNFLMMDEPTNHLDVASKEALEEALNKYDGALLLISHDRYFLDKIVHRVIELRDGHLLQYEGNYSDYLAKRQAIETEAETESIAEISMTSPARKSKEQKRKEAEARQTIARERKRLNVEIETLESRIEALETRKSEIEAELGNPETYQNGARTAELQREYATVKSELATTEQRWEHANLDLEELIASIADEV
ncbi:ABC-F family ATP-binding cassette domain-containing protein [candidate division KSB1 bacterium]|nr:ABC-F family ATP-binding cassette domain-containing protein [candidate division KSB1 bacterium]